MLWIGLDYGFVGSTQVIKLATNVLTEIHDASNKVAEWIKAIVDKVKQRAVQHDPANTTRSVAAKNSGSLVSSNRRSPMVLRTYHNAPADMFVYLQCISGEETEPLVRELHQAECKFQRF